jgi:hypothetical protein
MFWHHVIQVIQYFFCLLRFLQSSAFFQSPFRLVCCRFLTGHREPSSSVSLLYPPPCYPAHSPFRSSEHYLLSSYNSSCYPVNSPFRLFSCHLLSLQSSPCSPVLAGLHWRSICLAVIHSHFDWQTVPFSPINYLNHRLHRHSCYYAPPPPHSVWELYYCVTRLRKGWARQEPVGKICTKSRSFARTLGDTA